MLFKEESALYATEVERRQGEDILYVNFMKAGFAPSIADNPDIMARTVDFLAENSGVARIVFVQQRNYSYSFEQVSMLHEIARMYQYLFKQETILSPNKMAFFGDIREVYSELSSFLLLLRQDPIACYLRVKRRAGQLREQLKSDEQNSYLKNYVLFLERFLSMLATTKLIMNWEESGSFSGREFYKIAFRADVLPNFTFTRLVAQFPPEAELIDQYLLKSENEEITVTVLKKQNDAKYFYHLLPPEYTLSEEHHMLLHLSRNVLIEHRPKAEEFTDPEKTRQVFFNVAKDLLSELAQSKKIALSYRELMKLANILVRYTIGFGLIELLLLDDNLQDIVVNAPIAQNPIFVRHEKYDECSTNILPSYEDAESWAAKLRLQSGRPLDEAHPILDTDLVFGNIRARIAAIKEPLSPSGLAYALRRHRDKPWTLPLFIKRKMLNSFAAGLLSFIIDGSRTVLVAGTRSSGKTSLLGSLMLEISPKVRTIVIEDSVTKDSKMFFKKNGRFFKTNIGELIDEKIKNNGFVDVDGREKELNKEGIEIFAVNKKGKVILSKPSKFIRHKVNKPIYEIITSSGRKIKVTEDHSLFSLDTQNILKAVKPKELKEGDFIAVPLNLPFNNALGSINILDNTEKLNKKGLFVSGKSIEDYIKDSRKDLFSLAYSLKYPKSTIQNWTTKKMLPLEIFEKIRSNFNTDDLFIKQGASLKKMPCKIILDTDFLAFAGLWIADGCYDSRSIIFSVEEEENKQLVRNIAKRFDLEIKYHSDKKSIMINSILLKEIMSKILFLNGDSYTKQIPSWVYNLSSQQAGSLLRGLFDGDGCVSDKEVIFSSASKDLVSDVSSLLLRYNIILRIGRKKTRVSSYGEDRTIDSKIGSVKMLNKFRENIGFSVDSKRNKLVKLCNRVSTHDTSDVIPLSLESKESLSKIIKSRCFRTDYIGNGSNIGREHLNQLISSISQNSKLADSLGDIVDSDIFWDKVNSVKEVSEKGYVYDISVPECENFICENIIAHNTLELPADSLRKLGYDILRMKVRSALVSGTTEIEASEGIRTSLRLGDSALIIGEVRSNEARALYEAMRIGALANVVAGTIHGDSPYGVFDRVVHDLDVPATSFKATDIIIIANPVKTPDGLHSVRRIISVTEVRKHWLQDPLQEGGFVELLKYNVEKDELEPTPELINGDSEVLKSIASQVKGWAGNWDVIYDNIILRGKIKQEIVEIAEKLGKPELLEAEFNVLAHIVFHKICEKIIAERGLPLEEYVFPVWKEWLMNEVKRF